MFVWKDENEQKRGWGWPIFKTKRLKLEPQYLKPLHKIEVANKGGWLWWPRTPRLIQKVFCSAT